MKGTSRALYGGMYVQVVETWWGFPPLRKVHTGRVVLGEMTPQPDCWLGVRMMYDRLCGRNTHKRDNGTDAERVTAAATVDPPATYPCAVFVYGRPEKYQYF